MPLTGSTAVLTATRSSRKQGALSARHLARLVKATFGLCGGPIRGLLEQHIGSAANIERGAQHRRAQRLGLLNEGVQMSYQAGGEFAEAGPRW